MTADATIRLPVTIERRHGRGRGYVARYGTYPHDIQASGATASEAKANLTAALVTAIDTIMTQMPKFGRDDDGAFLAAVPKADGGCQVWRVTDTTFGGTLTSQPASQAFDGCYHQTPIPYR